MSPISLISYVSLRPQNKKGGTGHCNVNPGKRDCGHIIQQDVLTSRVYETTLQSPLNCLKVQVLILNFLALFLPCDSSVDCRAAGVKGLRYQQEKS